MKTHHGTLVYTWPADRLIFCLQIQKKILKSCVQLMSTVSIFDHMAGLNQAQSHTVSTVMDSEATSLNLTKIVLWLWAVVLP
jgi:hypothetical protein